MIVVVGAGITGLAIGHELLESGVDFIILEASDRVGGVIHSGKMGGHVLDWGPQRGRLTPDFRERVSKFGLDDELLVAEADLGLLIYHDGGLRRVPLSIPEMFTTNALSLRGATRVLLEPITAGPRDNERVDAYFRRKVGSEAYDTLVGPFFGGLYGSNPADMDVEVALAPVLSRAGVRRSLLAPMIKRGRVSAAPAFSFQDGMERLPQAMAKTLGDRVRLTAPVEMISAGGSGWDVKVGDTGERIKAEQIVMATPAPAAAKLLEHQVPKAAATIKALNHNPIAIVHVTADLDADAMGFQVAFSESHRALRGVTFQHCLFNRPRLFSTFLGGALNPAIVDADDALLANTAAKEFEETTGAPAEAISVWRTQMPAWDLSWRALKDLKLPAGLHVAGSWHARAGLPGRFAEAKSVATSVLGVSTQGPDGQL